MATVLRFEDLDVWKLARSLNRKLWPHLVLLKQKGEYDLRSQLDRSAGSVMDNVAEGFERDGNREFLQHLAISKASLVETRSQLYRMFDRDMIREPEFEELKNETISLAGKIRNFMNYLRTSGLKGHKFKE